jgi:hypothetical protein
MKLFLSNRPAIAEALRLCRLHRATLIIAKVDRLARNFHFISSLMESGVESAESATIQGRALLSEMAEDVRSRIGVRRALTSRGISRTGVRDGIS